MERATRSVRSALQGGGWFLLLVILTTSLSLNLIFLDWGLPAVWHPDEVTRQATLMVKERRCEPDSFAYPTLHIYSVLLSSTPYFAVHGMDVTPPTNSTAGSDARTLRGRITPYARALSGVLGAATVLLLFLTAARMFGRTAAFLSAAFLAGTAGFVHFAHFATVDLPMVFWSTLAFYLCVRATDKPSRSAYLLAGLFVGLAASAKYTAVLLLPALALTFLCGERDRAGRSIRSTLLSTDALRLGLSVALGFALGTPYALITPLSFLRDFIQLNFYQPSYGGPEPYGFVRHVLNVFEMSGPFLFVVYFAGFAFVCYLAVRRRHTHEVLIAVTGLAIYLKMGSMRFAPERYILPLIPFLALVGGLLVATLLRLSSRSRALRRMLLAIIGIGIGFSYYYSALAVREFRDDDRNLCRQWIMENVDETDTVEVSHNYGVTRPDGYLHYHELPYYHYKHSHVKVRSNELYKKLERIYDKLKGRERGVEEVSLEDEPSHVDLPALLERRPNYLVLSRGSYERFLTDEARELFPLQNEMYTAILEGRTPYVLAADFRKRDSWLCPMLEFVNAGVSVHRHESIQR